MRVGENLGWKGLPVGAILAHELGRPACIDGDAFCGALTEGAAGGARKKGTQPEPPDDAQGRSRGGFGTNLHLLLDGNGVFVAMRLNGGQTHETTKLYFGESRKWLRRRPTWNRARRCNSGSKPLRLSLGVRFPTHVAPD